MDKKYFVYHLHSDYSSCTTNIDSVTKVDMYIKRAKELGMTALAFSEHGNIFNWYEKKTKIEEVGMKYVHAIEMYITETISEKIRDNYHCILIAKNYEGFLEINKLVSISNNRNDGHFYYRPRITIDELLNVSDNIIITSACLASILHNGNEKLQKKYIEYFAEHNDRCFLEIQHHNIKEQIEYNRTLFELSQKYGIKLITGTDTHSLNELYAKARLIEQKAHKTSFPEEESWDLTFKTYDELVIAYQNQGSLPIDVVLEAIENTNLVEDMVKEFSIDKNPKYPKLYDNAIEKFTKSICDAVNTHPYILKSHTKEEVVKRIEEEIPVYQSTNTIDFMMFQKFVRDWEHSNGIYTGAGRGSVSGSLIAYILGITDMDSLKFDLKFFRFLNPGRVTNCDVDSDYYEPDRNKVRDFLLTYDKIKSAEIAAFGTIAMKGAIRDVGRALEIPLEEVSQICNSLLLNEKKEFYAPDKLKKQYPELFKWVDVLTGVIVSVGTHPAGVLCATRPIDEEIGLFSLGTTEHLVSSLDMYGLDACMWTKLDCLGLDNVGIINETCKLAGIDRITPDNIDLEDMEVWEDIAQDTSMIFQWESSLASNVAQRLLSKEVISKIKKELPNVKILKIFSFGNALLRPCGASIRDEVSNGRIIKTGVKDIDELLAPELGNCVVQESFMSFVMQFCGFTLNEADKLRKSVAKKKSDLLNEIIPTIKKGFIEHSQQKYNLSDKKVDEILDPIIQCITDASRYAFSWNHSDAYSFIGYACGWLRHYYPLEFVTTCLNVWSDKEDKTALVIDYANRHNIKINQPKFRYSRATYYMDKENNSIYKGIASIKGLNSSCAEELFNLRNNQYEDFISLLKDIKEHVSIRKDQLKTLIILDFFSEFGNSHELDFINNLFSTKFKYGSAKMIKKSSLENEDNVFEDIIKRFSRETKTQYVIEDMNSLLKEMESYVKYLNFTEYPIKYKIDYQMEYLGYISFKTDKPQDRNRLLVLDVKPLKTKDKSKVWAYAISEISIGSGKVSEFIVYAKTYHQLEIMKNDIIIAERKDLVKKEYNGRVSWYLNKYRIESEEAQ